MAHYLVSEGSTRIRSEAGKGAQPLSDPVPTGICHAAAAGAERTVCGVDTENLVLWDQPWSQGFMASLRCRECSAILR